MRQLLICLYAVYLVGNFQSVSTAAEFGRFSRLLRF